MAKQFNTIQLTGAGGETAAQKKKREQEEAAKAAALAQIKADAKNVAAQKALSDAKTASASQKAKEAASAQIKSDAKTVAAQKALDDAKAASSAQKASESAKKTVSGGGKSRDGADTTGSKTSTTHTTESGNTAGGIGGTLSGDTKTKTETPITGGGSGTMLKGNNFMVALADDTMNDVNTVGNKVIPSVAEESPADQAIRLIVNNDNSGAPNKEVQTLNYTTNQPVTGIQPEDNMKIPIYLPVVDSAPASAPTQIPTSSASGPASPKEPSKSLESAPEQTSDLSSAEEYIKELVANLYQPKQIDAPVWNYQQSDEVTAAQNAYNEYTKNHPDAWTGGQYGEALQSALDKILNREQFSYDLNSDMLYQQYRDQYMREGEKAMRDTMGQAAALTGGYGSSYANSVASQAYQGYLDQLNDRVPELYQLALDKYNNEGQELYNQYSALDSLYNQEYGRYRDTLSDYYTEASRLQGDYQNAYNKDYGQYSDKYASEYNNYASQLSTEQYLANLALQQASLAENVRANLAGEAYNNRALDETIRAHLAGEDYNNRALAESIRHNQAGEAYNQSALAESIRQNNADNEYRNRAFNETVRMNDADIAYRNASLAETNRHNLMNENNDALKAAMSASASGSASGANGKVTSTETVNTRNLENTLMSASELSNRGRVVIGGATYTNYPGYVEAKIEEWYNNGRIDDGEAMYLYNKYISGKGQ